MDKCAHHDEHMEKIANAVMDIKEASIRMEMSQKAMSKRMDDKFDQFDDHLLASIPVRDNVRDNTKFRNGATKAIWVIYGVIISLLAKVFLFK